MAYRGLSTSSVTFPTPSRRSRQKSAARPAVRCTRELVSVAWGLGILGVFFFFFWGGVVFAGGFLVDGIVPTNDI